MPSVDVYPSSPPQEKDPSELSCQATCANFNEGRPAGTVTTFAYRSNDTQVRFTTNVAGDALKTYLEGQYPGYNVVAV